MRPEDAIDDLDYILSDEIELHKKESQMSEAELANLRADYRAVFLGSPEGKRVLADLINETGFLETCFSKYSAQTFYNEGKRDIGVKLMDYCFNLKDRERPKENK